MYTPSTYHMILFIWCVHHCTMTYVQGTQEENIGVYKECDNIAIVTFSQLKAQNTFTEGDRRNSEHMYDV